MKYSIVVLLLLNTFCASAQKQHIYADGAISLAYFDPGFSTTYNYYPVKHIGIGAGVQGYVFHPAKTNPRHFTPAAYLDVRFRIRPEKISQYFIFMDFGMNFYKHNNNSFIEGNYSYSVPNDNGIYIGLGMGYFIRLTHRGWGAYISTTLLNNIYRKNILNLTTNETTSINAAGGTAVVSLGFRFLDDNRDNKTQR